MSEQFAATPINVEVRPPESFPNRAAPAPAPTPAAPAPQAPAPAPAEQQGDAPAPAPSAPAPSPAPTPDPKAPSFVDPPAPTPSEGLVYEYQSTGDAGLDLALGFIGNLGIGPEHPALKAATQGDFKPMEAHLKSLGDKAKGYERYIAAATDSYGRRAAARQAQEKQVLDVITSAVGGAENWNSIHEWVAREASPEQKAEITKAFAAGPYAAQAMASQLAALYRQSGQAKAKSAVSPNAAAAPAAGGGALSAAEYRAEVRALFAKYGYRAEDTQAMRDLNARYLSSKK